MGINTPLQRDLAVQIAEVAGAHKAMVRRRVVFSEVVGEVVGSFAPVDMIVALGGTVFDPVETHVNGFGAFLLNCVVRKTNSGGVVDLDGCGWLGMAHFGKGGADGNSFLGIDVSGADFCFGCGAHDVSHNFADGVDGAIDGWFLGRRLQWRKGAVGRAEMAACAAAGTGDGEVGGVGVNVEPHIAGHIAYGGIGVSVGIVQEPSNVMPCLGSGFCLIRGEVAKGDEHSGIDSNGVVKECANNLLDEVDFAGV